MQYEHITFVTEQGVSRLTINRPAVMNALSGAAVEEISHALTWIRDEGQSRVLLITGAGRAFCSGAEIGTDLVPRGRATDAGVLLERYFNPLMEQMSRLPVPIVAAVNGVAAGAGCSLALAADFVVAAKPAYFLLAFVNVGLVPDAGASWLLPRLVGRARALQLMMLGERLDATTAEQWGLIYKSVEMAQLESEALTLAERLARGPTQAYALIRQALRASMSGTFSESLLLERHNQMLASRTEDFAEGISAFQSKRPPVFQGK